jgi:DNA-binding NarL/FixJ family response regulator
MSIRVLLVDDHSVVREGYRRLLERHAEFAIVGEAASAEAAYLAFCQIGADVVVLDIALPGASGLQAMTRILAREPETRFVVCSMHEDPMYVEKSFDLGAMAYVSKAAAGDMLLDAIRQAHHGKRFVSADLLPALNQWRTRRERTAPALSTREIDVLRMLAQGKLIDEIATALTLSEKTVSNYQTQLRQKLGARNAAQLAAVARDLGFG